MSFIHRTIPMLAFAAGCAAFAPAAFAQLTPVTLVSFTGKNGQTPLGSLLADASGNLYGTTYLGGASKAGTVFELSPPAKGGTAWTETVLASFNGANGENPWAELIADASGNLYSTTSAGGAANDGTIFELSPPAGGSGAWTLSTLLSFAGADGANPLAGLVADASGNLYGTASTGGANACLCGTVVEVSPPSGGGAWTETVLTSLTKSVGARPSASLFLDKSGKLYGTTRKAGASHSGAVFKLTPPGNGDTTWTAADLVGFTGQNGSLPIGGLIQDSAKNFYGTTLAGGPANVGTVYELSPPAGGSKTWTETMLYSFTIPTGESPHGSLIADAAGNLYGTTAGGGANHKGTVYELSPPTGGGTVWTETVLVSFNGTNGAFPSGSLIADASGNLYGTTSAGGAANRGTVFEVEGTGFKVK
jgi:uncharacterized repeat protein (TIGR03803 family)